MTYYDAIPLTPIWKYRPNCERESMSAAVLANAVLMLFTPCRRLTIRLPPVASNRNKCLPHRSHVVDSQDLHALGQRASRPRRRCPPCGQPSLSPSTLPMKPFREWPTNSGQPSSWNRQQFAISVRLCSCVLPKPMPGSRQMRSAIDARGHQRVAPLAQIIVNLGDDVVDTSDCLASSAACLACASRTRARRSFRATSMHLGDRQPARSRR